MNSSFTEDLVTTTNPSWNFESFLQNHLETENLGKRRSTTGLLGKTKTVISRNAARERSRVRSLRNAFQSLQMSLPSVPPNTKLSKLDVLILATTYISHLRRILSQDVLEQGNENYSALEGSTDRGTLVPFTFDDRRSMRWETSYLHPVRKWPMRSRLYAGVAECSTNVTPTFTHDFSSHRKGIYN